MLPPHSWTYKRKKFLYSFPAFFNIKSHCDEKCFNKIIKKEKFSSLLLPASFFMLFTFAAAFFFLLHFHSTQTSHTEHSYEQFSIQNHLPKMRERSASQLQPCMNNIYMRISFFIQIFFLFLLLVVAKHTFIYMWSKWKIFHRFSMTENVKLFTHM